MIVEKGKIHPSAIIAEGAKLGKNITVGPGAIIHSCADIGDETFIGAQCIIGEPAAGLWETASDDGPVRIGPASIIRSGTIIYRNVTAAERFETGHRATIRENSSFGVNNRIGTQTDIQGDCSFGDYVRLHSNVFAGKLAKLGSFVWIFPHVVLTNDPYPPSDTLLGVEIGDYSAVAASAVILPGVRIGSNCLVGAAALLKEDLPDGMFAAGNPARIIGEAAKLKNKFEGGAQAYPWPEHFSRGMPWEESGRADWLEKQKRG